MGTGRDALRSALRLSRSGLAPCHFADVTLTTSVGEVPGVNASALPADQAAYDCRNNRLARIGLTQDGFAQAAAESSERFGAQRVGVILGTSTAGIFETELAYRQRDPQSGALPADFVYHGTHNVFSVADFTRLTSA